MFYSLLLAGGQSTRMGQDKRLLEFQGQSLLQRSLLLLENSGADKVLISGDVPEQEGIPDLLENCGPLAGLHATVHHIDRIQGLDNSLLLVIPVDMPLLDNDVLKKLIVSIGETKSCHYENEIFPCVFRLTPQLRDHLDNLFVDSRELGGKRSMKSLLITFDALSLSQQHLPDNVFLNVNRPQDWSRLKQINLQQ